jgi:hypothetical protein
LMWGMVINRRLTLLSESTLCNPFLGITLIVFPTSLEI